MEYHGNHYFFSIKNSVFAPGRSDVSYLIQLCTCYIKYFMFQVKCTGFPFWVSGWDTLTPTLYLKYGVTWLKNLMGVKIGNIGLYIFLRHFHIYLYQKSIARGKNYNCTMKTTKMTKNHIIPKTEINLVNWIRFVYSVCIIFETTTLCYLFLTISCVKNIWNITEEK